MMYHFLAAESSEAGGFAASPGGAASSAAGCTRASGTAAEPGCSSNGTFSSVSMPCLFREKQKDPPDTSAQNAIHDREVSREGEHRDNHHRCGTFHLLAVRPGHAPHLKLQVVDVILRALNPVLFVGHNSSVAAHSQIARGVWQGRRDSNPHSRFWRPLVCR